MIPFLFLGVTYCLVVSSMSSVKDKYMPYVGNGYIAMKINDPAIYVNEFYNGPAVGLYDVSHRAAVPNYIQSVKFLGGVEQNDILYELDVKNGKFIRRSTLMISGTEYPIKEVFYSHQRYEGLLIYELSPVNGFLGGHSICFEIKNTTGSKDLKIMEVEHFDSRNLTLYHAKTTIEETETTGLQSLYFMKPTHTKFCPSFTDPQASYFRYLLYFDAVNHLPIPTNFLDSYTQFSTRTDLLSTHESDWRDIWTSNISVEGNEELNTIIQTSIYYILSSIPQNGIFSLSPGSLSSNDYNGHTFWDTETWMFPPLIPLYPKFAKSCLNYRLQKRPGAKKKAEKNGFKGYMFPWESALSGTETCPQIAPTGILEQHISSDVVFAFKSFFNMFGDSKFMTEEEKLEMFDLVKGVADFWVSRVSVRTGEPLNYDILDVIPPDEYHEGNNSVFTNAGAQISLEFADELAKKFGKKSDPNWGEVASRLFFPVRKIEGREIDWEFEEYEGDVIKQADVVLLAYPLMWKSANMKNNLEYYEHKVDFNGPSMTHGIHAIEWLELGNQTAGYQNFLRSYQFNVQKPFYVWTEVAGGVGAVNFITGAGNFLQGVLYGYCGLRILGGGRIRLNPILIPNTKSMKVSKIHFQDTVFSLEIHNDQTSTIELIEGNGKNLMMEFIGTGQGMWERPVLLEEGKPFVLQNREVEMFITSPVPPPTPSTTTTTEDEGNEGSEAGRVIVGVVVGLGTVCCCFLVLGICVVFLVGIVVLYWIANGPTARYFSVFSVGRRTVSEEAEVIEDPHDPLVDEENEGEDFY